MKLSMYIRFVLFVTNDTNWCTLVPDNALVLILSNDIRIQDGEHREDTIKTTCSTPYNKECGKIGGANLDHYG